MKKRLLLLLVILVALLAFWVFTRRNSIPEIPFTKVVRETIENKLSTNGKVEPIEWASARAERSGVIEKILVQKGRKVESGTPLVELDSRDARADLQAALARIEQARAEREVLTKGGRASELAEIDNSVARSRIDLSVAQHDYEVAQRLYSKQAGTMHDVTDARERVERAKLQIKGLEERRASLVVQTDRTVADAKIQEAEATAATARHRIELSVVRAPLGGTVYQFDLRVGAFLNPGDLVASIGRLDRVRVVVYVDEPELGRVAKGMAVSITWDAMPGRQWKGVVERVPSQIVPLGTRQVGEVSCVIENPDGDLLPGTNINAEIHSKVIENALTVPKEALRRAASDSGVYLLGSDNRVAWRPITIGASSITRSQVISGVSEGDAVALPTERPLKDGVRVVPIYP